MDVNYNKQPLVTAPLIEGEPANQPFSTFTLVPWQETSQWNSIIWYELNGIDQSSPEQEGNYQVMLYGTSQEDDQEEGQVIQ